VKAGSNNGIVPAPETSLNESHMLETEIKPKQIKIDLTKYPPHSGDEPVEAIYNPDAPFFPLDSGEKDQKAVLIALGLGATAGLIWAFWPLLTGRLKDKEPQLSGGAIKPKVVTI